jgi:tight adherence protein C
MTWMLIFGLLLVAAGGWMLVDATSVTGRAIRAQLRRASAYATLDTREQELAGSARDRLVAPLVQRLSGMALRLSPQANRAQLAGKLRAAGVVMRPQSFLAIKAGIPLSCIAAGLLGTVTGAPFLLPAGLAVGTLGWLLPDMYLTRRARARRETMSRSLPDTLDLLTVSVEAGLGFDAAVAKVCEKMDGPLIDELDMMAREIRVGETRRQALRNLAERAGSVEVASFARSVIQAEELGTSLGRTLRVQAADIRIKRQLAAEEQAMKAPVKMLFPTVLFIFPAMFIIILGPAFLNIMKSFGG